MSSKSTVVILKGLLWVSTKIFAKKDIFDYFCLNVRCCEYFCKKKNPTSRKYAVFRKIFAFRKNFKLHFRGNPSFSETKKLTGKGKNYGQVGGPEVGA